MTSGVPAVVWSGVVLMICAAYGFAAQRMPDRPWTLALIGALSGGGFMVGLGVWVLHAPPAFYVKYALLVAVLGFIQAPLRIYGARKHEREKTQARGSDQESSSGGSPK